MAELNLRLHRQQSRAMMAPAEEILYGGAAGGGKSHLIRAAFITWAQAVPGLQLYLFRRTFPELKMNHLEGPGSFPELLAPLTNRGLARIVDKDIRFPNGSLIALRHLQYAKDLTIYQGAEIHVLGFDEATHFTDAEYRYLRGRCRVSGIQIPESCPWTFPRVLLGTNPGGRGHHWCKQGFVDHGPYRVHRASEEDGGMRRVFIPARLEDNPSLLEADPEYIKRLEGLGDKILVRALKEGDWNVVAGAMFADQWRHERHTVQPFAIPPDWPIWIGGDDGYDAPSCIIWLTQDPKRKTIYAIRELYQDHLLPKPLAQGMADIHFRIPIRGRKPDSPTIHNELPIQGDYDSAAFAQRGESKKGGRGDQIKRALQENGWGTIRPCEKWPGSRLHRCQLLHSLMGPNEHDPSGMPGFRIFQGCCPNLERTLPTLGRDKDNPEDVDTDEEDHPYDALTYGLQRKDRRVRRQAVGGM